MKKFKLLLVFIILMFLFNINIYAASANLSVSNNKVTVGDTFTIKLNINSAAAWNLHVTSSGPVKGCSINQANATDDAMDANKTFSALCTATGEGTIIINLSGDVTSASDGLPNKVYDSKSVIVMKKVTTTKKETTTKYNKTSTKNNTTKKNKVTTTNQPTPTSNKKSNNNKLKEISVEGYSLTKIDDNNYILNVLDSTDSIKINATAEDKNAKISGIGEHKIKSNTDIEIIITAEDGTQNKITIKVNKGEVCSPTASSTIVEKKNINVFIIISIIEFIVIILLIIKKKYKTINNINDVNDSKKIDFDDFPNNN